jgi:hypothetical protein
MTDLKITATAWQDPLFEQLRQQVSECSDHYPVVMLPVRLETRFRKEARYIQKVNPSDALITKLLERLWKQFYAIRLTNITAGKLTANKAGEIIENLKDPLEAIRDDLKKVKEISTNDRRIFREALTDFSTELKGAIFSKFVSLKPLQDELITMSNSTIDVLTSLPSPATSPTQSGRDALAQLEKLEDLVALIYGVKQIPSSRLDKTLSDIGQCMKKFEEIVEQPGFLASADTIAAISSKISYIKRSQKNSPVRLIDFRKTYTGKTDLISREYQLRNEINDLKIRIDGDYVPYMELLEKLHEYPVRQLHYLVDRSAMTLKAMNDAGFANAASLLKERDNIYAGLRRIRERAHRPLEGSFAEITALKQGYDKLENEIGRIIATAGGFININKTQKAGLTRLRTHLTREYLEDFKELRTSEKTIESQAFTSDKVRTTALAAHKTLSGLKDAAETLKGITMPAEKAMIRANQVMEELAQKLRVTTTNTILLPRETYNQTRNAFQSLTDHINNLYTVNKVPKNHFLKPKIGSSLENIREYVADQFTDVFNERDKFYDDFRKRITFLVHAEVINELWVRIYPDDISIDNHDERLTESEMQAGKDYYNAVYSLPASERGDAMLPAWRAASAVLGARRAAWVIRNIIPGEVISNTVKNPENQVKAINSTLSGAFATGRDSWSASHEQMYSGLVRNLHATLSGTTLLPHAFEPCTRTRPDLEELAAIIRDADQWYQQWLDKYGSFLKTAMVAEHTSLQKAGQAVLEYFRENLAALHTDYDPQLKFPDVETKSREWDRAGITSVMPDRFIVATKRGDAFRQIKVGRPISRSLNIGFDPDEEQTDQFVQLPNGELNIPDKIRWMYDFNAAVDAGMAVRIPLQQEDFKEGFDLVIAWGVYTHENTPKSEKAAEGQRLFNELMENHLYSDGGLEYLPVDTATNNTDSVKSPYKTLDHDHDALFDLFIKQTTHHGNLPYNDFNEMEMSDGQFFRDALGLPDTVAGFIRHHDKQDIVQSRAMSRILFGATLGYHMRIMLRNLFTSNDMYQVIPFMMRHVSSVGNLPAFRIDKQPYGVLPITLHNKLWVRESTKTGTYGSFIHKLSMFLAATREVFESDMVKQVLSINHPKYSDDPQKVFLEILGLEPYSKMFHFRDGANVAGRWGNTSEIEEAEIINWGEEYAVDPAHVTAQYDYLLNKLKGTAQEDMVRTMLGSRAYGARYVTSNDLMGNLVQHADYGRGALHKGFTGNRNYIEWIRDFAENPLNLFDIGETQPADGKYNTLLFELLRIGFLYDKGTFSRRAASKVAGLDVPKLERLMAGHLDLCSHRIDAWQTGIADYRLRELRAAKPTGLFMGSYGFVEKLRYHDNAVREQHPPAGLESQDGTEIFHVEDNQGFIHGPSLNHAVTAAVLRAGYNSQLRNANTSNNIFGINMSSSRIRKALHLLEGAANGQETGALLGYQFERALHENYRDNNGQFLEMDAYIFRLRRKFPTYSDNPASEGTAFDQKEAIRALNVVDGLALLDHMEKFIQDSSALTWDDDKTFTEMLVRESGATFTFPGFPWGLKDQLPPITTAAGASNIELNKMKVRAIVSELDNMADSLDAMGDLITSEGVYQLVRGNHTRAGAVLSAMSEGRIPPHPEIIKTMREGNMITQRVIITLNHAAPPAGWSILPQGPRAKAEPAVNNWLAHQIGDPLSIGWQASDDENILHLTLADLALQPVDLVILTASGEEGLNELELRAADAARSRGIPAGNDIRIDFNTAGSPSQKGLGEFLSLLQQLGKIVMKARGADARDFRIAETDENFGFGAPGLDTDALLARLQDAVAEYRSLLMPLAAFIPGQELTPQQTDAAIHISKTLTGWGFNGYYPGSDGTAGKDDLQARMISARERITGNLLQIDQLLTELPLEPDQTRWMESCREISGLLFGKGFNIIPQVFINDADSYLDRMNQPHAGGILRNLGSDALENWAAEVSMVRKNLAPLDTTRMLTEVLDNEKEEFSILQLPFADDSGDYWMGAPWPETWEPAEDKLSIAVYGYQRLAETTSALVLDEWTEIIPSRRQTTGIALHYNQPDARPPQALLLAVSPVVSGSWSLDDLGLIAEEAYKMARIRAVEPDHFNETLLAQILPATTLISGGDEEVVRNMFSIELSASSEGKKGVLADFSSINHGINKEEI